MERFTTITSTVIPLPIKDVDTDLIIPAQFLTSTSKSGYGKNLFRRLKDSDPSFPLNLPRYSGAEILLTESNFGCGSSREHAVWALQDAGIKVLIGSSFADIFSGNSAKNGLLLITLSEENTKNLFSLTSQGLLTLSVALSTETITGDSLSLKFSYDPFRKHCFLNGLDDIDYLLSHREKIDAYREMRAGEQYFSTLKPNHS